MTLNITINPIQRGYVVMCVCKLEYDASAAQSQNPTNKHTIVFCGSFSFKEAQNKDRDTVVFVKTDVPTPIQYKEEQRGEEKKIGEIRTAD